MSRQDKLPTDWERVKLRKLVAIDKESLGAKTPPDYEFLYASLSDVNSGVINRDLPLIKFSDAPSRARRKVKKGDVLFSTVRPNLEGYARINGQVNNLIASTGFAVLSPKAITDTDFIYQYLYSYDIKKQIYALVVGSNYPAVNSSDVANLKFSIPKSVGEQKAIADLLSTWDETIEKTERLIQAKERRFRWLLRSLISDQCSMNNEKAEWKKVKLGDVGEIKKGKGITKADLTDKGVPCVRYAEIYTYYQFHTSKLQSFVTHGAFESAFKIKTGDILFAASGETQEEIGKCIAYLGADIACTGGDTLILRTSKDSCDSKYLGFALNHPEVNRQKSAYAHGNSVVHLYGKDLANIEIALPPINDQKQISETLSAAQHEIDLLKQLADKYKTQKRGLMQRLLTGEWRIQPDVVKTFEE